MTILMGILYLVILIGSIIFFYILGAKMTLRLLIDGMKKQGLSKEQIMKIVEGLE